LKPNSSARHPDDSFLKPGAGPLSTDCGSGVVHLARRGGLAPAGVIAIWLWVRMPRQRSRNVRDVALRSMGEAQPAGGQVPVTADAAARRSWLRPPATWVAVLSGLVVVSAVAMIPLSLLSREYFNGAVPLVIGVPCAVVGVLVARRQPRNPIGWLLLVIAACPFLATDGGDYALLGYHLPLGPLAVVLDQLWGPGLLLLFVVILLFPDGELPSRLWRWALRAYCALYAALLGALAVATAHVIIGHPVHVDSSGGLVGIDHAVGWFKQVQSPVVLVLAVLSLCFIGRQVLSWRRSSGERRQQLKWLASGATFTVVSAVLSVSGAGTSAIWLLNVVGGLAWFGFAALPLSIGGGDPEVPAV
jgi:hypothetical protein